jgi:dihydroorotate dehydrogenase (NAD+) catalytic subunit
MFKQDLTFRSPLMNAAGILGFIPNWRGPVDLSRLGVFVTNPVSLAPRKPAESRVMLPFTGGFLLHTGLPNPGLRAVMRNCAAAWARSPVPVIVSLLANQPDEIARMAQRLEEVVGVMGIEIGLPPGATADLAVAFCQAAQGELPVIVSLPPERVLELGPRLKAAGVRMVSLAPPRGSLPGPDGRLVRGRLYGPGLLPASLLAVAQAVELGLDVIGSGGVYTPQDISAMRAAGAIAVQMDAVLWKELLIVDF